MLVERGPYMFCLTVTRVEFEVDTILNPPGRYAIAGYPNPNRPIETHTSNARYGAWTLESLHLLNARSWCIV